MNLNSEKHLVILIHGWGGDNLSFNSEVLNYLDFNGYEVQIPILPNPSEQDFTQSYKTIEDIIKNFNATKISLIAHSSGGYLACKIAENYQIDKLLLIAPACPTQSWSEDRLNSVNKWLSGELLEKYLSFHSENIDLSKVRENTQHLEIIFGLKDPYIDETNRDYYINGLSKIDRLYIFEDCGHMTGEEWPVKYAVENLFIK